MNANLEASAPRPDLWTAIKRGLAQRCPVCGEGKLFRSYLKLSDRCSGCGAKLSELRADDGPAWATILIVGHLIVPFFIVTVRSNAPEWIYYAVLFPLTIALTLLLLPRSKGVFVALLYAFDVKTGVPEAKPEASAS
ncbi:MAG TPA: DUF983 domain-containing protein [Stellaceae bacterium]|jgi:uncharacterized protein (DUF983 family)